MKTITIISIIVINFIIILSVQIGYSFKSVYPDFELTNYLWFSEIILLFIFFIFLERQGKKEMIAEWNK